MRSRGDQLLDLCRRSRDLDRSLGLYRDVCDLSLNLDSDCLLDRDCQSFPAGSPLLLEYIRESKTQPYSPSRSAPRWSLQCLGRGAPNPRRVAQGSATAQRRHIAIQPHIIVRRRTRSANVRGDAPT